MGNAAASYKGTLSCEVQEMTTNTDRLKVQLDSIMMDFDSAKVALERIEDDVVSKVDNCS